MESKFTAYLLHKFLEQMDTNLVFPVSIRMRPSKKAYKTSIFETNLVNSYRIMFDFSCLLSGRSRVRIPASVPSPEKLRFFGAFPHFYSRRFSFPIRQKPSFTGISWLTLRPFASDGRVSVRCFHTFFLQLCKQNRPVSDVMNKPHDPQRGR